MNTISRSMRAALGALVAGAAVAGTLAVASPPALAGTSWTHNNAYSYSPLKSQPTYAAGYEVWDEYNDQPVTMLCYTDGQYVTDRNYSNYNSGRWFRVRDYSGRTGYMHSSYVYYQTTVGHC